MKRERRMNAEQKRLEAQRTGAEDWRLWGPYLSERAWGTVREDYSAYGEAWEHFSHDQARSRCGTGATRSSRSGPSALPAMRVITARTSRNIIFISTLLRATAGCAIS